MVKLNINGIGRRTARLTMPVGQAGSWLLASGFWLLAYGLWLRYASRHLSPSITLRVLGHEGFCPAFAPLHLLSLPIFGHVGKL